MIPGRLRTRACLGVAALLLVPAAVVAAGPVHAGQQSPELPVPPVSPSPEPPPEPEPEPEPSSAPPPPSPPPEPEPPPARTTTATPSSSAARTLAPSAPTPAATRSAADADDDAQPTSTGSPEGTGTPSPAPELVEQTPVAEAVVDPPAPADPLTRLVQAVVALALLLGAAGGAGLYLTRHPSEEPSS
ncbi:MAG TPA: hypothetical protein VM433_07305 [Mycobacteriales bacterium]|nr:hypothetical protein [Mycobacteriales bacterium]